MIRTLGRQKLAVLAHAVGMQVGHVKRRMQAACGRRDFEGNRHDPVQRTLDPAGRDGEESPGESQQGDSDDEVSRTAQLAIQQLGKK